MLLRFRVFARQFRLCVTAHSSTHEPNLRPGVLGKRGVGRPRPFLSGVPTLKPKRECGFVQYTVRRRKHRAYFQYRETYRLNRGQAIPLIALFRPVIIGPKGSPRLFAMPVSLFYTNSALYPHKCPDVTRTQTVCPTKSRCAAK